MSGSRADPETTGGPTAQTTGRAAVAAFLRSSRARWAAVILLCLLPAVIALLYIRAYGVNSVFEDQLTFPILYRKYYEGRLKFQDFFEQDNEHRPLFPRLLMFPLGLATRYNSVAEMYVSWGFICLSAVTVFLLCRRLHPDRLTAATVFIPAAWILFSLGQTENLLMGWQLILTMANAFLLLSMYFLQRARGLDRWMIAAALSGLVASFSFSGMLLIWPVGLGMILQQKPSGEASLGKGRGPALLFWTLFGIAVWAAFFAGWHKPPWYPSLSTGLRRPLAFAAYVCNYLSAPLGQTKDSWFLVLPTYLGAAALAFRRRGSGKPLPAMPVGMILFAVGVAAVTAAARIGFGPHQALQSRYQSLSGLGLIGLYLLWLQFLPGFHLRIAAYDATWLLGGLLLFFLVIRPMYAEAYGDGERTFRERALFAYHLRTAELQSDPVMKTLCRDTKFGRSVCHILRRLQFNVFAEPLLPPRADRRRVDEKELPHVIDSFMGRPFHGDSEPFTVTRDMDTISVAGRAHDESAHAPAAGVFIEVDGAMDFPAAYGLPRLDRASFGHTPGYHHYSGFEADFATSLLPPGRHTLRVMVVSADGKSCALSAEALLLEIPARSDDVLSEP
jgi:hypothetical protein